VAKNSTSFGNGNLAAVTHGIRSPRIMALRTEDIVARWLDPETGLTPRPPRRSSRTVGHGLRLCAVARDNGVAGAA